MYRQYDNIITTEDRALDETMIGGIGYVLFKHMEKYSDKVVQIDAVTGKGETSTQLLQKCVRTSIVLQKTGIQKGDIVTYYSTIHMNAVVPMVACFLIGAIPSFIDNALSLRDTTHLLRQVMPKLVVTDQQFLKKVEDLMKDADINIKLVVFDEHFFEYQEEEHGFRPIFVNDLGQLAIIHFSSGSTGMPKGICLNHYFFLYTPVIEGDKLVGKGEQMVLYSYDSFYWTTELLRFISSVKQGNYRLVNSEKFDAQKIWYILEKYKVNRVDMIPFDIIRMCNAGKPEDVNLTSLTTIFSEGAALPKHYILKLQEMLPHVDVFQAYGQTETGYLATFIKTDLHKTYSRTKAGSVGCIIQGCGVSYKVTNVNTGKNVGPNQEGEIRVKSKTVMLGYYNLDSSDCFDEDGWLKTGDLGYYDEDFCFYITGRIKEIITHRGWHISLASLEADLYTHCAVAKAAVIGLPHPIDGERPLALIVVNDDAKASAKVFENYMKDKVPNMSITIKFVKDIPLTPTGKIKREELKRRVLSGDI